MGKRKRSKLSLEEIIEKWKRPYINIMFLTLHFQDKEDGLRLLHYRYALVKEPEMELDSEKRMEEFFGWKLKQLKYINKIEKCITSTENLSKYLKKLVKMGIVKRIPDEHFKNLATYKIDKKHFNKIDRVMRRVRLINIIKECPKSLLTKIEKNVNEELMKNYVKKIEKSVYPQKLKEHFKENVGDLFI
jgi:uncharacterized protein YlbG (UPF0298 family)